MTFNGEKENKPRLAYQARIIIDGDIKGQIYAHSMESLEEQLHKLEQVEERFNKGEFNKGE